MTGPRRRSVVTKEEERCEIGAHLHPWCAPPFEEKLTSRNSFMCNLPPQLQHEKLSRLTDAIEERFGRRSTSFRAGRYGIDATGIRILNQLGYLVDSSVIPFSDFKDEGGPAFTSAPFTPYFAADEDVSTPARAGAILEVPVSVGFSSPDFERANRFREQAARSPLRKMRLVGILDRLNISRRIKFSPEQSDAGRMRQLVDAYQANEAPCMVMLLHSSSLAPGFSPYVPDAAALEQFYANMEQTFAYCLNRSGMEGATLTEFAEAHAGVAA